MARKFRVKALSVGGGNKRIFNCNDIVTEDNFPRGRADELVKQNFLEIMEDEVPEQKGVSNVEAPELSIVHHLKTQMVEETEVDQEQNQEVEAENTDQEDKPVTGKKRGRKPKS